MWQTLVHYEHIELLNKENGSRWHHYDDVWFAFSESERFVLIKSRDTGNEDIIPTTNILALTRKESQYTC